LIKTREVDLGHYFEKSLLELMFGKSEYKRMMDALYTYRFMRERSMA